MNTKLLRIALPMLCVGSLLTLSACHHGDDDDRQSFTKAVAGVASTPVDDSEPFEELERPVPGRTVEVITAEDTEPLEL